MSNWIAIGVFAAAVFWAAPAASQDACAGGVEADLGFSTMRFNAGTSYVNQRRIEFGTEPVLNGIDPDGPAAGRLQEGDVLVAVDGALITTRAGSRRFDGIRPGVPTRLTVRRDGKVVDVRIVPGSQCAPSALAESGARMLYAAEELRRARPLGFSLSCSDCSLKLRPDGRMDWQVGSVPEVQSVAAGSPAERAGLRAGDRIERIDGVSVTSPDAAGQLLSPKPGQRVRLGILRGTKHLEVTVIAGG